MDLYGRIFALAACPTRNSWAAWLGFSAKLHQHDSRLSQLVTMSQPSLSKAANHTGLASTKSAVGAVVREVFFAACGQTAGICSIYSVQQGLNRPPPQVSWMESRAHCRNIGSSRGERLGKQTKSYLLFCTSRASKECQRTGRPDGQKVEQLYTFLRLLCPMWCYLFADVRE